MDARHHFSKEARRKTKNGRIVGRRRLEDRRKYQCARAPPLSVKKVDGGVSDSIRGSCFSSYECDAQKQKEVIFLRTKNQVF